MSKKCLCLVLSALLVALSFPAEAQQPVKIPRIGYVSGTGDPSNPGLQVEAFRRGLRDLGYIEGKNILIEYRYEEGNQDRAPRLVAELIQLNVDVLVAVPSPAIRAANPHFSRRDDDGIKLRAASPDHMITAMMRSTQLIATATEQAI